MGWRREWYLSSSKVFALGKETFVTDWRDLFIVDRGKPTTVANTWEGGDRNVMDCHGKE